MDDAVSVELAQRLREELPTLLDAGAVAGADAVLADIVERGRRGERVTVPLLTYVRGVPALRQRAGELVPADGQRGVHPPPGVARVPLAPRYVCPNGDYEYFRIDVARPVPTCPHDGADLVADGAAA
ncbi:hypothetical protein [Dactylosporangium sp. NPDC005555]|uniref:hypothetical protein n=1 Tax=Dactylosporangium sp. NPDC005555 TaxID=3154889 RepID=UPI0033ABC43A